MKNYHYLFCIELFTEMGIVIITTLCTSERQILEAPLKETLKAVTENESTINALKHMMEEQSTEHAIKCLKDGLIRSTSFLLITDVPEQAKKDLLITTQEKIKVYNINLGSIIS